MVSSPFQSSAGLGDVLFNEAVSARVRKKAPQNTFRILKRFGPSGDPWAVYWELSLRDWSGGGGKFAGPFEEFPNRYASAAGVDTTNPGYLQCAYASASTSASSISAPLAGVHHVNHPTYGLVWGVGDADNACLYVETSATDPTPAATDYDVGANQSIICMALITSNNAARRIVVGRAGAAAQIITLSGTTSTVAATMDAGTTTNLRWMVETPQSSGSGFIVLYQAGTTLYTRLTSDADTAAGTPSTTFTNLPQGGFALGYFGLRDKPLHRVWTVMPKDTSANASMLLFGSEALGEVNYWSPDGTDRDVLSFNEMPNGITQAVYVRGGIMATDGERVVHHTGVVETNYGIFDEAMGGGDPISIAIVPAPQVQGTAYWRCRGFAVQGDDCWALIETIQRSSALNELQWWKLDWETGAWHYYSTEVTAADSGTAVLTVLAAGSHPISHNTKTVQVLEASSSELWKRWTLPLTGENAYFGRNQTGVTKSWATGFLWTPRWTLPGLAGQVSVTESIAVTGDITVSGNAMRLYTWPQDGIWDYISTNTTAVGGASGSPIASVLFTAGDVFYKRRFQWMREFPQNSESWSEFLMRLDLLGNSSGTPLVTEIRVRGYTFLDPERLTTPGKMKEQR